MFDIVFISYQEPNADENYAKLKARFPFARRVHGVKGIQNAHIAAAGICYTSKFWIVDGDSTVLDTFDFSDPIDIWEDAVYVYRAINPINGLSYGYGGIKLFPRIPTLNMDPNTVDMTTSLSHNFFVVPQEASVTNFNTDPYNTWKSAFRECVKLSSKVIVNQVDTETEARLTTWCTKFDVPFGEYAYLGALAGKEYGTANRGDASALAKINDFAWLRQSFEEATNQTNEKNC